MNISPQLTTARRYQSQGTKKKGWTGQNQRNIRTLIKCKDEQSQINSRVEHTTDGKVKAVERTAATESLARIP